MNKLQMRRYAKLLAKTGINVKKGQWVIVQAELDQPEFVEMVVEELYRAGAGKVTVEWNHQPVTKVRYKYEAQDRLSAVEDWQKAKWEHQTKELPAMLHIISDDPDGLNGVDQEKYTAVRSVRSRAFKPSRDKMENNYQWCIAAVPGKAWAKKVFP
ncbi:MAG: aminopeptidase, partial [Candidatus Gallimonas sp.]